MWSRGIFKLRTPQIVRNPDVSRKKKNRVELFRLSQRLQGSASSCIFLPSRSLISSFVVIICWECKGILGRV